MSEVPTSDWNSNQDGETSTKAAPIELNWQNAGSIKHVFTHFELQLFVFSAVISQKNICNAALSDGWWSKPDEIADEALPNLMKKVISAARSDMFKN